MSDANRELVEQGDLDELARHATRLADGGWWDDLVDLVERCRAAVARGKQLWPIEALASYRFALDGPDALAARAVTDANPSARFTLGPPAEVAAMHHTWAALDPFLDADTQPAVAFAQERVLRGERLESVSLANVEVPLALQDFEPAYPTAEYHPDRADFPLPTTVAVELPFVSVAGRTRPDADDEREAADALAAIARVWAAESNGRTEAVAIRGRAADAVRSLGLPECRLAEVAASEALALLAWTAASGGANGRRRGMAAGRVAAWWAAAAVAGISEPWPVDPSELGEAVGELRWFVWDGGGPEPGWSCRIAVEDRAEGLAFALNAIDYRL